MSKAEILAELPKLGAEDRLQLFARLCELQEQDLLRGSQPTMREKSLLDEALAEHQQDGHRGVAWREALRKVRSESQP